MPKEPKIVVHQSVLRGFRKRALAAYPKEHIESVWGRVEGLRVMVYAIQPLAYRSTETEVTIPEESIEEDVEAAKDAGFAVLGTIHTHPDFSCNSCGHRERADCSPSEQDWMDLARHPEVVTGICQVHQGKRRRSTRIRFYLAQKPLRMNVN